MRALLLVGLLGLLACSADAASSGQGEDEINGSSGGQPKRAEGTSGGAPSNGGSTTNPNPSRTAGTFPEKWIDGTDCANEPKVQSWEYAPNTFILRQSLCTHGEGPFLYLLIGKQKALLLDSGTGNVDVQAKVAELLAGKQLDLVVAHSHSHGDHVGGDRFFANKPRTTVVKKTPADVRTFFGITSDAPATFDLGDRPLDVMHIPGHEAAHIAIYDRSTKAFLTGDTLYPGRLFIDDWTSYAKTIGRLVSFVDDPAHPITHVLGAHIEMPKTGADYPMGAQQHPNEHLLQLTTTELRELDTAVKAMGATPEREVHPHFIVSP